jgi:hypothetical protein
MIFLLPVKLARKPNDCHAAKMRHGFLRFFDHPFVQG